MWAIVHYVSYDREGNIGHALRRAGQPPVRTVAIHCGPAAVNCQGSRHDRPSAPNRSGIEKRPHHAALSMTAMDITIHSTFLPHDDADASLAFYRDTLGFEVRNDVGYGGMRWITVGPADQPRTSIVLEPPAADPGVTDDERRMIAEMMAKGSYARIILATEDLDGTFERLQAGGADVVQEPTEQPYGVRDCAFRDPAGNLIRINELP
jgi:catechol 2,3-dioxygenase-like lactoylglutathione lyase family enzyme